MAAVIRFLQREVLMKRHLKVQPLSSRTFTNGSRVHREELDCRLAKSSDFDDVVKLSNGVYGGYDYIPVVFYHWLKMENIAIMLLHEGTKLIGLGACCIVDDGRTFVRRAGRISSNLRGLGLRRTFAVALDEYVRENFPKVSRERVVGFEELKTKAVNPYRKIQEQDVVAFNVEGRPFRTEKLAHAVNGAVEIETFTKEYFNVILSPPVNEKLFSNNVLIFDWCPFDPLRSNIDIILRENDLHFFVEKGFDENPPRSLSHGVYAQRVKTKIWQATFYTDNPVIFEAHLLHQFKRACEVIEDKFTFFTVQDENMTPYARRILEDILQLNDANVAQFMNGRTMKLYERDFSR